VPGSFGSNDSKWSGERERQERERQRQLQREMLKQARLEREAQEARDAQAAKERATEPESTPTTSRTTPPRESLSASTPAVEPETPSATTEPTASSGGRSRVGRRWREAAGATTDTNALPPLPNLPGDQKRGGSTSSRIIIFGAILFLVMAIVAFLPFGPFGDGGSSTPTPTATAQPVIASVPTTVNAAGTPQLASTTTAGDDQPIVCVDAGHGGWDYGFQRTWDQMSTTGPTLNESEINLGMAYMLKDILEANGITVVMTRTTGAAVNTYGADVNGNGLTIFDGADEKERRQNGDWDELQARVDICNAAGADLMISLHINGWEGDGGEDVRGYEVLYTQEREFGDLNAEFANDVYRRISQAMSNAGYTGSGRDVKPDNELEAGRYEFGSAEHLLLTGPSYDEPINKFRESEMPGIICEPVFLSNDEDANFIAQTENQQILVEAYAAGILDYFAKHPG